MKRTGSCSMAPMLPLAKSFLEEWPCAGRFDGEWGGAAMVAISPRALSRATSPLLALEGDYGLQMECLWKQVYQSDADRSIPGWLQRAEVAGEGGGVAGDINKPSRPNGGEALADISAEAGTWRVDDNEVGSGSGRRLEEEQCVLCDALVPGPVEIAGEIRGGSW